MDIKHLFVNLGKLLLCGIVFFVGMIVGGMIAQSLQLVPPAMPAGTDASTIVLYMLLTSPILALALAPLACGLSGSFLTRTLVLSFLTWIAYTVNTQLEASVFMPGSVGLYSVVASIFQSLLFGATLAWLFRPDKKGPDLRGAYKTFFGSRGKGDWAWRLAIAGVAFMPIYYFFGLIAIQFTGAYYQQNMYGLRMAGLDQILPILFVRSLLFLLACLPVLMTWQESTVSLFLRLGLALFFLVGIVTMLDAYWMPLAVRVPHSLEILADELTYAGVLVTLLVKGSFVSDRKPAAVGSIATG